MRRSKIKLQSSEWSLLSVISVSIIGGLLLGLGYMYVLIIIVLIVFTGIFSFNNSGYFNRLLILGFFLILLGFARSSYISSSADLKNTQWLSLYVGEKKEFVGVVKNIKTNKLSSKEIVLGDLEEFQTKNKLPGKLLVKVKNYPEFYNGENLKLTCLIKKPEFSEGEFDYDKYLRRIGVYAMCLYPDKVEKLAAARRVSFSSILFDLRSSLEYKINRFFPEPEASLLAGSVIGIKRYLPIEFESNLRRTGTSHIVVVSGANIAFLLMLLLGLSPFIGRVESLSLSLLSILFYVFLVGFDPPVLRSLCMFIPIFVAKLVGREIGVIENILFAAGFLAFINPFIFLDISFQLSFLSTIGLVVLVPILGRLYFPFSGYVKEIFIISLSAQIMTFPIIVYNFGVISLSSVFINMVVSFLVPIITYGGFLFVVFVYFSSFLSQVMSILLLAPLRLFVLVVNWGGSFKWSMFSYTNISLSFVFLYYTVVILFVISNNLLKRED